MTLLTMPLNGAVPEDLIASLPAISLESINGAAALQTRVDRKYVLGGGELVSLLTAVGSRLAALEVNGQRSFGYESVYFDTVDLESFRAAAHRRRRRFKVRTRSYVDSCTTMLEVKTKGHRGATVKTRRSHDFGDRRELDAGAQNFVDSLLGRPKLASSLTPVLTTRYDRMTVLDLDDVTRMTIDSGLVCTTPDGAYIGLDKFIVETKSAGAPGVVDRQLWSQGIRPSRLSKFGTGMAALDPSLPSNKWNRTLQQYFR